MNFCPPVDRFASNGDSPRSVVCEATEEPHRGTYDTVDRVRRVGWLKVEGDFVNKPAVISPCEDVANAFLIRRTICDTVERTAKRT